MDYRTQAKEITKGMAVALAGQKENTAGGKELELWLKNLAEKGGEYEIMDRQQSKLISAKDSIMRVYNQSVSDIRKKITYGQRVQNPVPADKKASPIRSVIMFMSTLAALFVALLAILFFENKKTI